MTAQLDHRRVQNLMRHGVVAVTLVTTLAGLGACSSKAKPAATRAVSSPNEANPAYLDDYCVGQVINTFALAWQTVAAAGIDPDQTYSSPPSGFALAFTNAYANHAPAGAPGTQANRYVANANNDISQNLNAYFTRYTLSLKTSREVAAASCYRSEQAGYWSVLDPDTAADPPPSTWHGVAYAQATQPAAAQGNPPPPGETSAPSNPATATAPTGSALSGIPTLTPFASEADCVSRLPQMATDVQKVLDQAATQPTGSNVYAEQFAAELGATDGEHPTPSSTALFMVINDHAAPNAACAASFPATPSKTSCPSASHVAPAGCPGIASIAGALVFKGVAAKPTALSSSSAAIEITGKIADYKGAIFLGPSNFAVTLQGGAAVNGITLLDSNGATLHDSAVSPGSTSLRLVVPASLASLKGGSVTLTFDDGGDPAKDQPARWSL